MAAFAAPDGRADDGHLGRDYNPFASPQLECPFPIWRRSRERQPVFHSDVLDAWVVTRYADVVAVLRDTDTFGPGYGGRKLFAEPCPEADVLLSSLPPVEETNTISTEPPLHTKLRRYLQSALIPQRVEARSDLAHELAHRLVDSFVGEGSGDFYALYARQFPLLVIGHLIGLPEAHFDRVSEWAKDRVALRFGNLSAAEQVAAARRQLESHRFTMEVVFRRRGDPGDDLISAMVQESDASDDPLTDEQLAAQVTDLLTAGHETSAYFLTMLIRRVVPDRPLWAQLADDHDLRTAVILESLRIERPAHSLWRNAKRDTELGAVRIPAGARVTLVLGSANLDDAVFDRADAFDVSRSNAASHLAFGRGIHTCVGASVARMEARVSLEVLSARLPGLRLAADDELSFRPSANLRAAERLLVEWA